MRNALFALLALVLSGCDTTIGGLRDQVDELDEAGMDRIVAWAVVAEKDARSAGELADFVGDEKASACWWPLADELAKIAKYREKAEELEAAGSGYFLLAQRIRTVRRFLEDPPDSLDPCYLLWAETEDTLSGLLGRAGIPITGL